MEPKRAGRDSTPVITIEEKEFHEWELLPIPKMIWEPRYEYKYGWSSYKLYIIKVNRIRVDAFLKYRNALAKKKRLESDANK